MLYLIDGSYYVFSSFFAPLGLQLTSPTGEPTTATHIFIGEMLDLIQKKSPEYLAVCFEGTTKTFRKEIYEGYKSSRKEGMPPEFWQQMTRIKEILEAMGVRCFSKDGFEADDLIGTFSKIGINSGQEVVICTNDKDMCQLVSPSCKIWEMKSGKETDREKVAEKWGVHPGQMIDFLALQGDESDCVPGVPGIGPKNAAKLLQEYGTLESIYNNLWQIKGRLQDVLRKGRQSAILSKKLVAIDRDVPGLVQDISELKLGSPNLSKLRELFESLGFQKHQKKLESIWRL